MAKSVTGLAPRETPLITKTIQGETMDSGVCYHPYFSDPDGNALILHHRYAPPGVKPPA